MSRLKKMLLAAVAGMAVVAGVAASPASATVPTEGEATPRRRTSPISRGVASTFASATATRSRARDRPQRRQLGTRGLERGSGQRLDPGPVPARRPAHFTNGCAYAGFASQKAGVAFIKLIVSGQHGATTSTSSSWSAGWIQPPAVTGGGDVTAGDFNSARSSPTSLRRRVVDPYRGLRPAANNHAPRHGDVKGNIPLKANFSEWGLGDHLTMPDDWGTLGRRRSALVGRSPAVRLDHQLGHP